MGRRRVFDRAEARRLRRKGLTYEQIGAELGVSGESVRVALDPEAYRRLRVAFKRCAASVCVDCGAETQGRYTGTLRCRPCANLKRATSVRDGELRCVDCKTWKPDDEYARDSSKIARRGRRSQCRSCNTTATRRLRESKRVPCSGCGRPVDPPKGKRPECHACFLERQRAERRQAAA